MSVLGIDIRRGRTGRYEFTFATNDGCLKGVVEVNPYGMTPVETERKALEKIHDLIEVMVSVARFDDDDEPDIDEPLQEARSGLGRGANASSPARSD